METPLNFNTYKAVFDITPVPCIIVRPDYPNFTIVAVNKQYLKATLLPQVHFLDKGLFDALTINPDDEHIEENISALKAALLQVITTKQSVNQGLVRFDIKIPDTETFQRKYWTGISTPVFDESGEVAFILNSPIDVTENQELLLREKQLDEESQIQRDFYKCVFMKAPVGVGLWEGPEFVAKMINPALATFYKRDWASLIGKPTFESFPQTKMLWHPIMKQVYETGKAYTGIELSVDLEIAGEVQRSYVNYSIVPYYGSDGSIVGVLGVTLDTTQEVMLRKTLEESELKMKIAVESARLGVWDVDLLSKQIYSSSHRWIPGFPLEGSQYSIDAFFEQVVPEHRKLIEHAFSGLSDETEVQIKIKWSDNSLRWIQLTGNILRNESNVPIRIIGTTLDITDRKELETRKDELLSTVSHELKTPVTSIKAIAQILEKKFDHSTDLMTADLLHKLVNQVRRLTNLIHDLLDASLIEGGKLQLNKTHFFCNELVEEVVSDIQRTTTVHNISFNCNESIPCFSDKERIRQVIINLLTNAIKYSPEADKVNVTLTLNNQHLHCAVEDFGVGISEEKASKIFERFYRVIDDKHAGFQGIGIGLYISSQIISKLDGKIWFNSVPDHGTTFSFEIPQF